MIVLLINLVAMIYGNDIYLTKIEIFESKIGINVIIILANIIMQFIEVFSM